MKDDECSISWIPHRTFMLTDTRWLLRTGDCCDEGRQRIPRVVIENFCWTELFIGSVPVVPDRADGQGLPSNTIRIEHTTRRPENHAESTPPFLA